MNNKYKIFIDLDGTLLNNEGKISQNSINYLKKLYNEGHLIVLATGRPLLGVIDIYNQIGIKAPVISDNGSLVCVPDDETFEPIQIFMGKEKFKDLCIKLDGIYESAIFNINKKAYCHNLDERLYKLAKVNEDKGAEIVHCDFKEIDQTPYGFLLVVSKEKEQLFKDLINNTYKEFKYRYYFDTHLNNIAYPLYEIVLKKVSKASAIKLLLNKLNLTLNNSIAFGNDVNDFEMLDLVEHGVAMINSKNDILEFAKHHTKYSNDEEGVIKYLEKIIEDKGV